MDCAETIELLEKQAEAIHSVEGATWYLTGAAAVLFRIGNAEAAREVIFLRDLHWIYRGKHETTTG